MIRKLVLLAAVAAVVLSGRQRECQISPFACTEDPPKTCGPNEEYTECGTPCEPKCNEPMPDICTMNCIVDVCQCKPGFKRGPKGCVAPGPGCR